MITIDNISKQFGKLKVLDHFSIACDEGECIALIGPNGSGKTTLIKCILGMVFPDTGKIWYKDQDVTGAYQFREEIGYMPQIGRYPENMTVGQVLSMMKDIRKKSHIEPDEELYRAFELDKILDKRMRTLSGGTRQKVSACLAFLFRPQVIILDEPTAGLDPIASEILRSKILKEKQNGKLILLTSHVLSDLDDLITKILYIQDGQPRFFKGLDELKEMTGESRLSKAIVSMMIKTRES